MRPFFVLVLVRVLLAAPAMAQSVCRESSGYAVERQFGLIIQSISLNSPSGSFHARAVIPASGKTLNPVVFSFSTLLGSEPKQVVDMMPAAVQLAKRDMAVVVIERDLTWPAISKSVGKMQQTVLCAEQWLSAHADVRPDHWTFVGPDSDVPTFDQLHALPDTTSMTFFWDIPIGGPGEEKETEGILRESSYVLDAMLNRAVGIP
jgi:hypothetical protein